MKRSVLSVMFLVVPALLAMVPFSVTATASSTPAQLPVTLSAGTGSTAAWDAQGNPVLTAGTDAGTGAYVRVPGATGQAAPSAAPTFTSSPASSAGDPRWVVEFHNGCFLFGDGTTDHWAENPGGAQDVTYAVARQWATQSCGQDNWVTAAYIVADSGNHGITYTLANVQYGGAVVQQELSNEVVIRNRHSGKCLNEGGGVLSQYTCTAVGQHASLVWQVVTFADGSKYLKSLATGKFVQDGTQGQQLSLTSAPSQISIINGGIIRFPDTLVMDDKAMSTANFAQAIGWPYNGQDNQRWDFRLAV